MRFLHTADWHIGRRLHGFDLSAEQAHAFKQIETIALSEKVDGLILAGDLYDRSLPSESAVSMLDGMIRQLNLKDHLPIYAISGNHDSATRLNFGSPWFENTNFYMVTQLAQAFKPIELPDTQLFLLPYFEPFAAQQYFQDDSLQHLDQAIVPVINKIKNLFDPKKKHILVAHFFVSGAQTTDSETRLTVGGLAAVPVALLKDFDYVALGHLHGKDALKAKNARYSGSPVKFSLSEAQQEKGVWIVDTEPFKLTFKPIKPLHDVQQLTANFEDLLNPKFYQKYDRKNYFGITLKDVKPIPNVLARLREIYPNIIALNRENGYELNISKADLKLSQQEPMQLLADFYEKIAKDNLSEQQKKWAETALKIANDWGKQG